MAKYFSVATSGMTAQQDQALADFWRGRGWWHGVPGFWILKDITDQVTASDVRNDVRKIAPGARVMVIDMGVPATWASSSMNEANRDWLRKYFPPEGK